MLAERAWKQSKMIGSLFEIGRLFQESEYEFVEEARRPRYPDFFTILDCAVDKLRGEGARTQQLSFFSSTFQKKKPG
jgi:hypothetical protein